MTGPLTNTLTARVAGRVERPDDWQKTYTTPDSTGFAQISDQNHRGLGRRNILTGRLLLDWAPSDVLYVEPNLHGWRDHPETQAFPNY